MGGRRDSAGSETFTVVDFNEQELFPSSDEQRWRYFVYAVCAVTEHTDQLDEVRRRLNVHRRVKH
jgi:hypothetical protein